MQNDRQGKPAHEDVADEATIDHHALAETEAEASASDPHADEESWQLPGGRYQVVGEIARGGMGVVLRAVDTDVQRTLALKVMLGSPDDAQQQRFLEEARISGQLQHPGIPPVHEIGRLQDGRPFFSMKLIEGHTLTQLLQERETPQTDLPRYLKVFEQITQTLAYAHSRSIIHRDLKPSNVMVGAFGEVQVMDWGLARRLTEMESAAQSPGTVPVATDEETLPHAASNTSDRLTRHGQILGTPAYMPPEQARGQIESLDQRSDVFGLGAILCDVLTGHPPYKCGAGDSPLEQAARGDVAAAMRRLDACGADADLIHLAQECLAPASADRPMDAGAVAARVTAYLDSVQQRLKQAAIDQAAAHAKAVEERKRRRVGMALLASLFLLLMSVGGAAAWYLNDRAVRASEEAERNFRAAAKKTQGEAEIDASLKDAQRNREELLEVLRDPQRAYTLMDRLGNWRSKLDAALLSVRRAESLARQVEVDAGLVTRTAALKRQLKSDLADHLFAVKLEGIRQHASTREASFDQSRVAAAYEEAFQAAELPILTGDPATLAKEIQKSPISPFLVAALDHWGQKSSRDAVARWRVLQVAREADPDEWRDQVRTRSNWLDGAALEDLATNCDVSQQSPQILVVLAERMRFFADVDSIPFLYKVQRHYPSDYWVNFTLGNHATDPDESVGFFRAALAVRPDSAVGHYNLSVSLREKGDSEGEVSALRQALSIDADFAYAHNNLGIWLSKNGDLDGAIDAYRRAIAADPQHARAHTNLGVALLAKEDSEGAIDAVRRAIAIDPDDAQAHYNLGKILSARQDLQGAIDAYRAAIAIDSEYAQAHYNLGISLHGNRDLDGASDAFREALAIDPKFANAYFNLAVVLGEKGDSDGAVSALRQAVAVDPAHANAHYQLGNVLKDKGDLAGAMIAWRRTLEIDPAFPEAHCNLGHALMLQGRFDEALLAYRRGHQLGSKISGWRYPSAVWLARAERFIELDRKLPAVLRGEVAPADASERLEFAVVLAHKQDYANAVRFYAEAFKAEPKHAGDLRSGHRYNAACAAALAIVEDGDGKISDEERTWLADARSWLRADLAVWTNLLNQNPKAASFIKETLRHWQNDSDLASVRDEAELAKLPAEERSAWHQMWADVRDLLSRIEAKKPGPATFDP